MYARSRRQRFATYSHTDDAALVVGRALGWNHSGMTSSADVPIEALGSRVSVVNAMASSKGAAEDAT
eukprot:SAG31_NODE_3649_length_4028_cov_2.261644_5_plen_67_part_00